MYSDSLFAINPDGTRKWACLLPGDPTFNSPAIDADGTIYVSVSTPSNPDKIDAVCAIDPDGTVKWTCPLEDHCFCSPSISANGILHVITIYGKMYAIGSETGIEEQEFHTVPLGVSCLCQINPNPFHSIADISYSLGYSANSTKLEIFDMSGRLIRRWDYSTVGQSNHIIWDGTDEQGNAVQNGVYFVRLSDTTGEYQSAGKLVLLR